MNCSYYNPYYQKVQDDFSPQGVFSCKGVKIVRRSLRQTRGSCEFMSLLYQKFCAKIGNFTEN